MFLDPLDAKMVFNSRLNITLISLGIQREISRFSKIHERLYLAKKMHESNAS